MENKVELELVCDGIEALPEVARRVIEFGEGYDCWRFEGEMGAGKTTLITTICAQLGILDSVSSPTFSIVNEYADERGESYFHFDFYRIKSEQEALDIGVEEYFDSGSLCMLEWASLIPSLLPEEYVMIELEAMDDGRRVIKLSKYHE